MYRFTIPNKSTHLLDINVKTFSKRSKNNKISVLNTEYTDILNKNKDKIEKYYNNNLWDKMKKIINPYELIYITNKKYRYKSLSFYEPLSRSYYKMIEMSHIFLKEYFTSEVLGNQGKSPEGVKSLHLAEGPGGFVEGWRYFRNNNKNDRLYAITLISPNKEIPSWKKTDLFLKNNQEVKILTGLDGKGDLYNADNIKYIKNRLGEHSMDIITGDGGFDFRFFNI